FGRTTRAEIALWGDADAGIEDLAAALDDEKNSRADYAKDIAALREGWQAQAAPRNSSTERPIDMARLIAALNKTLPADGILVADGGFAAHWAGLFFDPKAPGRHFVADRGLASIGYGLPGALGAQLAAPAAPVVGLTGDGGLNMVIGELETAKRSGANFTLIGVNNAPSGYVTALQHAIYGPGTSQSSDL